MGDEQYRLVLCLTDIDQFLLQCAFGQMIHGTEGLIHEDDLWIHGKGSGDAGSLPHTAGQLCRIFVLKTVQADHGDITL